MKLCSVCDKKIEGTWCKNCHRFVKTYELSEGIHFNESHNPANDKDCTYHVYSNDTKSGQSSVHKTSTSSTTYRQVQTSTQRSSNTGSTAKAPKKVKLVLIIIVIYLIGMVVSVVFPIIKQISNSVRDEFSSLTPENTEWNGVDLDEMQEAMDSFASIDMIELPPEVEAMFSGESTKQEKIEKLETLEPVEVYEEGDYICRYYNPEEIKALGEACTIAHYEMSLEEFEDWLDQYWPSGYEKEEYSSPYYNYYFELGEYNELSFSFYYDYYTEEDFAVRAEYDTVNEELHSVEFMALLGSDYSEVTDLMYQAIKLFDSNTEWTEKDMAEAVKSAAETDEVFEVYYSDSLQIMSIISEGILSFTFYPIGE